VWGERGDGNEGRHFKGVGEAGGTGSAFFTVATKLPPCFGVRRTNDRKKKKRKGGGGIIKTGIHFEGSIDWGHGKSRRRQSTAVEEGGGRKEGLGWPESLA